MSNIPNIDPKKHEALFKLYMMAFESFKINSKKKDSKLQEIKDISLQLKTPSTSFVTIDQIRSISITFSQPLEIPSSKTIEISLITLDSIVTNELLDSMTLLEVCHKFLNYFLNSFLKNYNMNDENINCKALNTCLLIYKNKQMTSHSDIVSNIIRICLHIYLSSKSQQSQLSAKSTLTQMIEYMIEQLEILHNRTATRRVSNFTNKDDLNSNNNFLIGLSSMNRHYSHQDLNSNNTKSISAIILDYLIDLIVISSHSNNENGLLNEYINFIRQIDNKSFDDIKQAFDKMKLDDTSKGLKNEKGIQSGKYGWCILCRNASNFFNEKVKISTCKSIECESELMKLFNPNSNRNSNSSQTLNESNLPRSDYITMLNAFSKISCKEPTKHNADEIVHNKNKSFCLEFILLMIEKGEKYFINDEEVMRTIKDLVMDSLVKNTLSSEINILKLSVTIFLSLVKKYREHLKDQIEIFINRVLIVILESENLGFAYKEVILDALIYFADNSVLLVEIYVNYDCDIKYKAVFYELISLLTKIINGLYKKPKYSNIYKQIGEMNIRDKCFEFFSRFNHNLSLLVEGNNKSDYNNIGGGMSNAQNETVYPEREESGLILNEQSIISGINSLGGEIKDKINQSLKLKGLLSKAIDKFNINPSSCLNFLKNNELIMNEQVFKTHKDNYISNKEKDLQLQDEDYLQQEVVNVMQTPFNSTINPVFTFLMSIKPLLVNEIAYEDFTAYEMAWFIRSNFKFLHQENMGKYLCSGNKYNIKVVTYFINSFDFKGVHLLDSLRLLFGEMIIVGEGQIIDRILQIFGEKYHRENPTLLKNPDYSLYISFSIILLNTDLHRNEVENKMSLQLYIKRVKELCQSEEIEDAYLSDIYQQVASNPLVIPGQTIHSNKSKKEIIKKEKESIIKTTVEQLKSISIISDNYITEIDNYNIRHLLDCSWSNFLNVFFQFFSSYEEEKILLSCIDNILMMGRTCGILHLDTIAEAFITTIINSTNLLEGKEITHRNFFSASELIKFAMNSGQYIRTCWYNVLMAISKIDYYQSVQSKSENDLFCKEIRKRSKLKNPEREIEIELRNCELICNKISNIVCDNIFSKTHMFDEEGILNFVQSLCLVSKNELEHYYNPRTYSLHKLVEVADFNIYRIQIEWVKIWKMISDHLVYVVISFDVDIIWRDALDSLRQTVNKLLQKPDLSIYNFQIDFFKPFEQIFIKSSDNSNRAELILTYIPTLIYNSKNIHSGWIVIFNILKCGLQRKNKKLNDDILKILERIYDDFSTVNNINPDVFRGYVECLCHMYLNDNLKQFAFETILKLLSKINNSMGNSISLNPNPLSFLQISSTLDKDSSLSNEKAYDYLKIFLYGLDDLLRINVVEHLNLLFEILLHNKDLIFSFDIKSIIYIHFCYFKPHLCSLILYFFEYKLTFFNKDFPQYTEWHSKKTIENIYFNIKLYLESTLSNLVQDLELVDSNNSLWSYLKGESCQDEISLEKKKQIVSFIKSLNKNYEKDRDLIIKKLNILKSFDENNFEIAIETFIEKFLDTISKIKDKHIKYYYFYEDLLLSIHSLCFFCKNSKGLFKILDTALVVNSSFVSISPKTWKRIAEGNLFILTSVANTKIDISENDLSVLIDFNGNFAQFYYSLIKNKNNDLSTYINKIEEYRLLNQIITRYLQIDLENEYNVFHIDKQSGCIDMLLTLSKIKQAFLESIESINDLHQEVSIVELNYLNKVFKKYYLSDVEDHEILHVIIFKLENLIPKFLKVYNEDELEIVFNCALNFIDSVNSNLRNAAKMLLQLFVDNNQIEFKAYISEIEKETKTETEESKEVMPYIEEVNDNNEKINNESKEKEVYQEEVEPDNNDDKDK